MPETYDVFISYARKNKDWVEPLYDRIVACETDDGSPVRVFMDVSGIRPGHSYFDELSRALTNTRKVLCAYTDHYFESRNCTWELGVALQLQNQRSEGNILVPVMMADPPCEIPLMVSHLHYIRTNEENWFENLCRHLGIRERKSQRSLRFLQIPDHVEVGRTLSPIVVELVGGLGPQATQEEVNLQCLRSSLRGTLSVPLVNNVATFHDVFVDESVVEDSFRASLPGIEVVSDPFTVVQAAQPLPERSDQGVTVENSVGVRRVVFFERGDAILVDYGDRYTVVGSADGALQGESVLPQWKAPVCMVRRSGEYVGVADWTGKVHLFDASGRHGTFQAGDPSRNLNIPGDLVVGDGEALIGMWDGRVFRWSFDEPTATAVAECPAGVSHLARHDDELYVLDFAGTLRRLTGGGATAEVGPGTLRLLASAHGLLAIGPDAATFVAYDLSSSSRERLPCEPITGVLADGPRPTLVDANGRGIRIDDNLNVVASFRDLAGSTPISADDSGRFGVLRNPDGRHTLVSHSSGIRAGIVLRTEGGAMAISPSGSQLAVADEGTLRIVEPSLVMQ